MFEAKLLQAGLFKKVLESIKDLVETANFDCSPEGISLQAMDSTHVTLINLVLRSSSDGFERYNCDRSLSLGLNLPSLSKVLKCAGNDDVLTIKARDNEADTVNFVFESPKSERVSEFEVKLLDTKNEQYSIRKSDYSAVITMPSAELQRICRDLSIIGDIVSISATKEGVKFSVSGDSGSGNITIKPTQSADTESDQQTTIVSKEPVALNFALKFLSSFTKATPLSTSVTLSMSEDIPIAVEYKIEELGYLCFFLAPKME